MTQWLVRTHQNQIHGPFSEEELRRTIAENRWDIRDELCRANQYWFSFSDADELKGQLGLVWSGKGLRPVVEDETTDEIEASRTRTLTPMPVERGAPEAPPAQEPLSGREDESSFQSWFWGALVFLAALVVLRVLGSLK